MPFTTATLIIVLVYTWILDPLTPRPVVIVPMAAVAALAVWHAARAGDWGFKTSAFAPALKPTALVTVIGVAAILAAGAIVGTLHDRRDFLGSLGGLLVWGGAQQWVLQTLVLREAQHATSDRAGVFVASALFASLHLPNPFLTAVTFVAALAWCGIYSRHPNVLPLALSHALGTLAILYAFDEAITGRLRVGYSYLQLLR
jgi:membrane protease YdiL (CAAX protease family)